MGCVFDGFYEKFIGLPEQILKKYQLAEANSVPPQAGKKN